MKKRLLLIFLLTLPIVSAQDITILGNEYSLVVVAPFAFMLLILFFFLLVVIKDKLSRLKSFKFRLFKFSLFKKKKKKDEKEKKQIIDFHGKLSYLRGRLARLSDKESLNEIYQFAKEFFTYTFNIKHEFALTELSSLIKEHVNEVNFANKLSELKYSDKEITRKDILLLYSELSSFISKYHATKLKPKKHILPNLHIELPKFHIRLPTFKLPSLKLKLPSLKLPTFKQKELHKKIKEEIKPKEKLKIPTPEISKEEFPKLAEVKQKVSLFNKLFKKPEYIKLEIPKKRKPFFIKTLIKSYKLKLDTRELNSSLIKLEKLIKKQYILSARKEYSKALLLYYKLPLKQEELFANRLTRLSTQIEKIHPKKELSEFTKLFLKLKQEKKTISKESLSLLNTFKNFIISEEELFLRNIRNQLSNIKNDLSLTEKSIIYYLTEKPRDYYETHLKSILTHIQKKKHKIGLELRKNRNSLLKTFNKDISSILNFTKKEEKLILKDISNLASNLKIKEQKFILTLGKEEHKLNNTINHLIKTIQKKELIISKNIRNQLKEIKEDLSLTEKSIIYYLTEKPRDYYDYYETHLSSILKHIQKKKHKISLELKKDGASLLKTFGEDISSIIKFTKKEEKLFLSSMSNFFHNLGSEEQKIAHTLTNLLNNLHKKELITLKHLKHKDKHILDKYITAPELEKPSKPLYLETQLPKKQLYKEFTKPIQVIHPKLEIQETKIKPTPTPKRTPVALQRLITEENKIYNKLNNLGVRELKRFKEKYPATKSKPYISRYQEFLKKIEPKDYKSKRLNELSEEENKIRSKLSEMN